ADFGRLLQKRLSVVTENELSHEAQLTAAILREEARVLVDAPDRYWLTFPETPYAFQFLGVHLVFASHPFRNRSDADRYLALLNQYPDLIHAFEAKLREQAKRGIRMAKEEIPLTAGAFALAGKEKEQNLFWVDSERLARLAPGDRDAFASRLGETISSRVRPAVARLTAYLSGEYASAAPTAVGLSQYPGRADYYRLLVPPTTRRGFKPHPIH